MAMKCSRNAQILFPILLHIIFYNFKPYDATIHKKERAVEKVRFFIQKFQKLPKNALLKLASGAKDLAKTGSF